MELFGFSIEVYIICFILAVPVFFFSRYLSRKFVKIKATRVVFTWLGTLILTPVLYASIICVWVLSSSYYPDNDFDAVKWKTDKEKRYELAKDLINSKRLIGMSKDEIRGLLGDEDNKNEDNEWTYYIGFIPSIGNIDPNDIHIIFKNNKVTNVIEH